MGGRRKTEANLITSGVTPNMTTSGPTESMISVCDIEHTNENNTRGQNSAQRHSSRLRGDHKIIHTVTMKMLSSQG